MLSQNPNEVSETKVGYKVCRKNDDGKLVSVVMYGWLWHSCYDIDQWTTPIKACGPLTVFDTLQNAIDFQLNWDLLMRPRLDELEAHKSDIDQYKIDISRSGYSSIFECEWLLWDQPLVHMSTLPIGNAYGIKALWQGKFALSTNELPRGTQLAKAVKLKKCVDR